MKKILALLLVSVFLLSACAPQATATPQSDPAAEAVQAYLQALANKDEANLMSLTCPGSENQALLELDAFAITTTTLENVVCVSAGNNAVQCTGALVSTYNNESVRIDLGLRTYIVSNTTGEWLVCGYTEPL